MRLLVPYCFLLNGDGVFDYWGRWRYCYRSIECKVVPRPQRCSVWPWSNANCKSCEVHATLSRRLLLQEFGYTIDSALITYFWKIQMHCSFLNLNCTYQNVFFLVFVFLVLELTSYISKLLQTFTSSLPFSKWRRKSYFSTCVIYKQEEDEDAKIIFCNLLLIFFTFHCLG